MERNGLSVIFYHMKDALSNTYDVTMQKKASRVTLSQRVKKTTHELGKAALHDYSPADG